ncbi:hypothetical protein JW879_03645 [candidate division WOR-3 bacterium]|nr:hypothetical protein [candidate division WOR-3 bacterium]
MKPRITQWIILGLIILMIFHPIFYFKKKVSPYGILLIDQSESMKEANRIKPESDFPLKNFYFGADKKGTDIGEAILAAVKTNPNASFIVLYSDGSNTKGKNPIEAASEIGIPVYFIVPELTEVTNKGFISVYGPNSVEEGDSAKITVHYKTPNTACLTIHYESEIRKTDIKREGIFDFSYLPSAGRKNIQFNLLIENDTADKINWSLDVKKRRELHIISDTPTWNHKFIKRYFEDKGWSVYRNEKDDIINENIWSSDVICFLSDPVKYRENIDNYLQKGGKIIVVSPVSPDLDFLPVIAPVLSKYSGKLPESYYLKAAGLRRNAKTLEITEEKVGYMMSIGKGTVIQFTYLELWKLALGSEQLYPENFFKELMDKILHELIVEEIPIFYSKKLSEGEDFIIRFDRNKKSINAFFWNEKKIPIAGDSIIIKKPTVGLHHFKIDLPSHSIEDSVLIVRETTDKMGIDTLMLKGIAEVSKGGQWDKDFKRENLEFKEKEIWINLRHNWFFIIFLLLLLFFDWALWMKRTK